jgi:hypothetical protein
MISEKECDIFNLNDREKISLQLIIKLLVEQPELIGGKKKVKPNPMTEAGRREIINKYLEGARTIIKPSPSHTIPDEMVSNILLWTFNYESHELEKIKVDHKNSMTAENMIGSILERYIERKAFKNGWIYCAGQVVKKIDFIKYQSNEWTLLQIKNRDNSENSSSSSVRHGTRIIKWFRTYSLKKKNNWERFPDEILKNELSEDDFTEFAKRYFSNQN